MPAAVPASSATDFVASTSAPGVRAERADDPARLQADLHAQVQCHAANLATLPNGDLACVWFSGSQEGVADISVYFSRLTPAEKARGTGGRWSTPIALSNDAHRSEQNPVLWTTPTGELWLLHTAQQAGNQDTAFVRRRISKDAGHTWSAADTLFSGPGVFVRQPPLVVGQRWLVPIFRCRSRPGERWTGDFDDSAVMISEDEGQHWRCVEVPDSIGCVHMNLVPSAQAQEVLAFFRSRWADHVYRTESQDGGETWSEPQALEVPNNNSSIQVIRLNAARSTLAMVCNFSSARDAKERRESLYDEIEDEPGVQREASATAQAHHQRADADTGARRSFWGAPRAPMTLAYSFDEGRTWPLSRPLETGDGYCLTNNSADRRNREYSYPSIHQTADGQIQVAYTVFRQFIRQVTLAPHWIEGARQI